MGYKDFFPNYINKRFLELDTNPSLNYKCDEITDFLILITKIWCISNKVYQTKAWVNLELIKEIVDSYEDTTMYFIEDTDTVLKSRDAGRVKMTDKQYKMLKTLYNMVETYDDNLEDCDKPELIVNDPKWDEVRQYAKLVYKEITGEDSTEDIKSWDIIP